MKSLARRMLAGPLAGGRPWPNYNFADFPDGPLPATMLGSTWAISSGKAVNSPTLGAEVLTNGDMETGDPPTGWSAVNSVLDGVADPRTGSAGAQSLSIANNGANYGYAQKAITTTQYGIIYVDAWLKNVSCNMQLTVPGATGLALPTTSAGTWIERKGTFYVTVASGALVRLTNASNTNGQESRADDISIKYHTLSELFSTVYRVHGSPMTIKAKYTIPDGSWGGVVARLDSRGNPQNLIVAFHDKTNIHLMTMIGGAWQTQLINTATTYVAGAIVEIRQTGATTYQLWYNGSQVGTDQTIDNAAINNNAFFGLFGPYGGAGAGSFFCSPNSVNPNRYLALGDSITAATASWIYLLCSDPSQSADLINRAVAGSHIMNDYAENLTNQIAAAASDDVTKVFIMMGTNDDDAGDMEAMQTLLETQLAVLKADHPNAEICYLNVLPRWTDNTGATPVDKANIRAAIVAACNTVGVTLWDTLTSPWISADQTSDGLHPNATGHAAIAGEVLTRI